MNSTVYANDCVWHGRCQYKWQGSPENEIPAIRDQEIHMFEGKNNRLLDSFAFRLVLMAAVFAVWSGAGYVLLSLA